MNFTTNKAIILARCHVGNGAAMDSSARLCLADAIEFQQEGNFHLAANAALRSLKYSVGVFHADYKKVEAFVLVLTNRGVQS